MNDEGKVPGKKWLGLLAVGFIGIALVVIAWAVQLADAKAKEDAAQKEVQKRLAALRQAGQPISFQDLAARYPDPPPEHDAELLLKPAAMALVQPKDSDNLPYFGGGWPSIDAPFNQQLLTALRAILETNKTALELVPDDELKPAWIGCGFANGFTNQPKTSLSSISCLSRLLCLDAVFKGVTGDSSGAAKSLEKSLLIGRIYKNDIILHGLLRAIMCKRACESLNQILNRAEMPDSDLKKISDLFPLVDSGFAKELFINERGFNLSEVKKLRAAANQVASQHPSLSKNIYRDQDLLEYLEIANSNLAAMNWPLSNAIPKLVELENLQNAREDQIIEANRRSRLFRSFFGQRISLVSLLGKPKASHLLAEETETIAFEKAAVTAIAIERYRRAHAGRLPEDLSALVPEYLVSVPKDPFDDHDLRFKKLERGYAVYSVGPDFTDDQGEPEPKDAENPIHYDVVFSVTR